MHAHDNHEQASRPGYIIHIQSWSTKSLIISDLVDYDVMHILHEQLLGTRSLPSMTLNFLYAIPFFH